MRKLFINLISSLILPLSFNSSVNCISKATLKLLTSVNLQLSPSDNLSTNLTSSTFNSLDNNSNNNSNRNNSSCNKKVEIEPFSNF